MYFEIQAQRKQVVETDNLRDVEKISCVDKSIFYKGLKLAEYRTTTRAAKVVAELLATFKSGNDVYQLPRR